MGRTQDDGAVALEALLGLLDELANAGLVSTAGVKKIGERAMAALAGGDDAGRRYVVARFDRAGSISEFNPQWFELRQP